MGKWVIALVAVAAALVAPSSLAEVVFARSVFHSQDLPSNTIRSVVVSCPGGYVATSAGISNPAPGVMLLTIRPLGATGYKFRFGNPAANADQAGDGCCCVPAPRLQGHYSLEGDARCRRR